jgi:hypothetical protein
MLIKNGTFTSNLIAILQEIFSRYESNVGSGLTEIEASRLWYQCSLRLLSLKEVLSDTVHSKSKKIISFEDFHRLLQRIITDDEKRYPIDLPEDEDENTDFKVRILNGNLHANIKSSCSSLTRFSAHLDRRKG